MAEHAQAVRARIPQTTAATGASTARFEFPAEAFGLAELFEHVPDARVDLVPAVANPDDHALLVIQTDESVSSVEAALQADSAVGTIERFGGHADGWIYRTTWEGRPYRLFRQFADADVTVLSMRGRGGRWKLRLLVPRREGVARADEIMDDLGCEADCQRVSTLGREANRSGLTDEQHEALTTAFEAGYYDIPREVTLEELAAGFGISHQALSERFRRAHRELTKDVTFIE